MTGRGPFKIETAEPIAVEINDHRIEFFGDPPEEAFLGLLEAQDSFVGKPVAEQIGAFALLRAGLRAMVVPASRDTFDTLHAEGLLNMTVVQQLFEHVTGAYGDALGFRGGSPQPSLSGRPANEATSTAPSEAGAEPLPV